MFWLEELPHELIAKICLQMDPWSLMSFLKASPELCRLFLLIAGPSREAGGLRSIHYPEFFQVEGLRWVNRDQFDPQATRALIKIYEVNLPEVNSVFALPHLSPIDSYVIGLQDFFNGSDHPLRRLFGRTLETQRVTYWRNHISQHISVSGLNRVNASGIDTHGLRQLEIVDAAKINGVDLGTLEQLTLVFSEPSDGSRPEFTNVTALKLCKLSIYYYDSPPVIRDIDFGGDDTGLGVLSLYHVPSLRYDRNRALPVYPSSIEELDFSAITSGIFLREVRIIGGHDNILLQLDMSATECLHWRQTCKQILPIPHLPSAPLLQNFSSESLLPDASMPAFCKQNVIKKLCIIGYDGLIFDTLWFNLQTIRYLRVHCRGEREGRAIPSLAAIGRLFGPHWRVRELVLDDFSTPPHGQNPIADQVVRLFDTSRERSYFSLQNVIEDRA